MDRFKEERRYVAEELRFGDAHSPFKATLNLDAPRRRSVAHIGPGVIPRFAGRRR